MRIVVKAVFASGWFAWLFSGVAWYHLYSQLSENPGPFWFDAVLSASVGALIASPVFGLWLLAERIGKL